MEHICTPVMFANGVLFGTNVFFSNRFLYVGNLYFKKKNVRKIEHHALAPGLLLTDYTIFIINVS